MGHWAPIKSALKPVTEAAKRQQEYLEEQKHPGQLAEHAEETVHVRGENVSKVYVVNLHPGLGVNPNAKPRDEAGASLVQGYHDSLGATVEHLRDEQRLSCDTRGLRVGAMVRRAAATQTVITQGKLPEMTLYEAYPDSDTPNGLAIVERNVA